jgi:hypothetical protein
MGLDLWFKEDVARILAGITETMTAAMNATAPLDIEQAEAYQLGFLDAVRAAAVAFGVAAPSMTDGNRSRNAHTRTHERGMISAPRTQAG